MRLSLTWRLKFWLTEITTYSQVCSEFSIGNQFRYEELIQKFLEFLQCFVIT